MKAFSVIESGLSAFMQYGPAALSAVQSVETAVGAGNGATKSQLAVAGVLAAVHSGETVQVPQVQVISTVIDTIVSALNALGSFKKAAPVTSVVVPSAAVKAA